MNLEQASSLLKQSSDHIVIERFQPKSEYHQDDNVKKKIGIFLDVETTGLDHTTAEIIELGMVKFEFCFEGKIYKILEDFDQFQEPSKPISETITKLTDITNEMVQGKSISAQDVQGFIQDSCIIIAHNAEFDRVFCEKYFPFFKNKSWACSLQEVDWNEEGFETGKLKYLAMEFGYFYQAHRAIDDCHASVHLLTQKLSKGTVLDSILKSARKNSYRILALYAPFEKKDLLKARGYRWNALKRTWYKDILEDKKEEERLFLQGVYEKEINLPFYKVNALNRYSNRIEGKE